MSFMGNGTTRSSQEIRLMQKLFHEESLVRIS
jgi:hypothetical protein